MGCELLAQQWDARDTVPFVRFAERAGADLTDQVPGRVLRAAVSIVPVQFSSLSSKPPVRRASIARGRPSDATVSV